ncbi:ATP-dependent RecD-like DNA helicase [Weissella kandleri]|nr:ATP-dependent RecD-like DNA helicase [Weissella kandleri]
MMQNNLNDFTAENGVEQLVGQVQNVIFAAPDSFYKVLAVEIKEHSFEFEEPEITVTGSFGDVQLGSVYQFSGTLKTHPRFGEQFNSQQYQRVQTNSTHGVVQYLSSDAFPGVGEKTAQKIVDALGQQAIDKILDNPALLKNLNLPKKQQETLIEQLQQTDGMERAIVALNNYGFGSKLASEVYQHFAEETLDVLEHDPYRLSLEVEGVSFQRIDQLALQMEMDALDERRIQAGIVHALNQATFENGDTYLSLDQTRQVAERVLMQNSATVIPDQQFEQALLELVEQGLVVADEQRLFIADVYYAEVQIAQKIVQLNTQKGGFTRSEAQTALTQAEKENPFPYSDEQKDAMLAALTNQLFILTGGPGTGKTTIINGVVAAYRILLQKTGMPSDRIDKGIKLAAPTGRAAKRLAEATGMEATTIHRLLGISGYGQLGDAEIEPLKGQLLIIDEMSMVDTELFSLLLASTPAHMQLIFVGDKDQLPSVGPGRVFYDLLQSGDLNFRELETIHRQEAGSTIIELASEVKQGRLPDDFQVRQPDRSFFPAHLPQIPKMMEQILTSWVQRGHSVKDMQILTPMYKTAAGVHQMNALAQSIFNPADSKRHELPGQEGDFKFIFRVGDKVMQKTNDPDNDVYNGDIGYIKTIMYARDVGNEIKKDYIEVEFDEADVLYQRSDLINLTLAYATTIHKAQGGEYSLVVMPLVQQFNRMLRRNLLYTGLTRAKDSLVLLGEPQAYVAAAVTPGAKRNTMLQIRLAAAIDGILPKLPDGQVQMTVDEKEKVSKDSKKVATSEPVEPELEFELTSSVVPEPEPAPKPESLPAGALTLQMVQMEQIPYNVGMEGVTPYDFL